MPFDSTCLHSCLVAAQLHRHYLALTLPPRPPTCVSATHVLPSPVLLPPTASPHLCYCHPLPSLTCATATHRLPSPVLLPPTASPQLCYYHPLPPLNCATATHPTNRVWSWAVVTAATASWRAWVHAWTMTRPGAVAAVAAAVAWYCSPPACHYVNCRGPPLTRRPSRTLTAPWGQG